MTRLATTPAYCTSCYTQDTSLRHVDFEAAYDGPVIPGTPEPVPVDDLVICERCIAEAFDILDPQGLKERISALEGHVQSLTREIQGKNRAIDGMRHTMNEVVEFGVRKSSGGRPDMKELSEETRKVVSEARHERNKDQVAKERKKRHSKAQSERMKEYWRKKKEEEEAKVGSN